MAGAVPTVPRLRLNFVCLGNICRSPLAHWVFEAKIKRAGLSGQVDVTSSGTAGHEGWSADDRSVLVGKESGYDPSRHRGRRIHRDDYVTCDLLLALDDSHQRHMVREAPGPAERAKVRMLMQYAGGGARTEAPLEDLNVPDPYYDDLDAFKDVLRMVETATDGLLDAVKGALASGDPGEALRAVVPQLPVGGPGGMRRH